MVFLAEAIVALVDLLPEFLRLSDRPPYGLIRVGDQFVASRPCVTVVGHVEGAASAKGHQVEIRMDTYIRVCEVRESDSETILATVSSKHDGPGYLLEIPRMVLMSQFDRLPTAI